MEIDRSKSLMEQSNHRQIPGSAQRTKIVPSRPNDDPKVGQTVRLYEDLTNLLVISMKHATGKWLGLDEWVMTCIYSYAEQTVSQDTRNFSPSFCTQVLKTR